MYDLTELFVYKFVFIAELLVAMHLFFFRRKKRSLYPLRIAIGAVICLGLGGAYPIAFYSAWYSSVMFFVLFTLCALSFAFIYYATAKQIFFLSVAAYTAQHSAHEIYALLANSFKLVVSPTMGMYGDSPINLIFDDRVVWVNLLVYIEIYFACYWILYNIFGKKVNKEEMQIKNFHVVVMAALILIVDIILNAVAVYISAGYSREYTYLTSFYNLICCSLIFYIQISLCVERNLRNELEIVSVLFHESEKRFKRSEENVMLLNLKCHDLKHQIREYAGKVSIDKEYVKDLVDIVDIYDSSVKTGNAALDLILTEKSLFCHRNKIILTCLADCSRLKFISDADLYSLFGNIVDNAIEAVMKITDKGKRSINVIVKNVGTFVSIEVDNYFSSGLIFDADGLPKTDKLEEGYHGFGLKSIKMITEKYGGDLNISANDNIFSLSILFPLSNEDVKVR